MDTFFSIIGLEINSYKLFVTKKVRSCECRIDGIEKFKFCPNCGKKPLEDYDEPISQIEENYSDKNALFGETLLGYPLVYTANGNRAFVAISVVCLDQGDAAKIELKDNIFELKEKLKKDMGTLGFWNEKKFGFWIIQYNEDYE